MYGDYNTLKKGFCFTNRKGVTYVILDNLVRFCVFEVLLIIVVNNFKELKAAFTNHYIETKYFSEYVKLFKGLQLGGAFCH